MSTVYQVEIQVKALEPYGDTTLFATFETDTDLATATENAILTLQQYSYYPPEGD